MSGDRTSQETGHTFPQGTNGASDPPHSIQTIKVLSNPDILELYIMKVTAQRSTAARFGSPGNALFRHTEFITHDFRFEGT